MTREEIKVLAEQISSAKMRRMTYEYGSLLVDALENEVHRVAGFDRFEDWYMEEFDELSCARTVWDIVKVERVRRQLKLSPLFIKSVDVSKAKKIAQLCCPDGRVKRGVIAADVIALFHLAVTESLEEINKKVNRLRT